jgi:hypothetical protein
MHTKRIEFNLIGQQNNSYHPWPQNILYRFIEGQTHFGMLRGTEVSLALHESKQVALHSKSNTTSKLHHKWKEIIVLYAKQQMENHRGTTSTKVPLS